MKNSLTYFFTFTALLLSLACASQKHDTLSTAKVFAKKEVNPAATTTPVQVLNKDDLQKRNSNSVADAVKYFAGVNVKDYGGIGGLKTVSVRSLGANHTGVLYDGLMLGDAQGGQTDLGKFSLDNVEEIQLYNAGPVNILTPARAFASASLLSVQTGSGNFKNRENEISLGLKQGSFGYRSPAVSAKIFIGNKFYTAVNASYQQAKGQYPFISYEDRNLIEKRINTDIKAFHFEYDAAYTFNDSNRISFKTYYYNSKRGLPGAVILFNNSSKQRLNDENIFYQSSWRNKISKKSSFLLNAKYSNDKSFYLDPSYPNIYGKLQNDFHQQEIYFSGAYKYELLPDLSVSYSSDYFNSRLKRTDILNAGFAEPNRNTFLNNIAVQLKKKNAEASANLLHTVINEKVLRGLHGRDLHEFTPALSASLAPFNNAPMRFRAFYKRIFRAPTFNDLYYTNIGNLNLRPEFADQYNAGITCNKRTAGRLSRITVTADGYINNVKDKILAVPRQNLFQWSMQNIGTVKIKGIDVAMHLKSKEIGKLNISSDLSYTYQEAIDKSDKNSSLYGKQIPYTPKHSGSAAISAEYKQTVFSYNVLFSSSRYRSGDAIPENLVGGWVTADLTLSHRFTANNYATYNIIAEANKYFQRTIRDHKIFTRCPALITGSVSMQHLKNIKQQHETEFYQQLCNIYSDRHYFRCM